MPLHEKCLLLGFGDIAQRLAKRLSHDDESYRYELTGVRRRPNTVNDVEVLAADCGDLSQIQPIVNRGFDVIIHTMTPTEISDQGYYQAYVRTIEVLLKALGQSQQPSPRLIVFVSSTSVYGQQQAEWVDEKSLTEPTSFSGKRLLEAENALLASPYPNCCVRFSGIYGSGRRRLIEQVLAGHGATKEPTIYSNRIHSEDCAGVLAHLINKQKTDMLESVYLASDCQPAPLYEVKMWLAEQLGVDKHSLVTRPVNRTMRSSKRCRNQRLLGSGYQFLYPDYQSGYRALLDEMHQ